MQQMPDPLLSRKNLADDVDKFIRMTFFAPLLVAVFSISLLAESSRASKEKFLGVHVRCFYCINKV